MKNRYRLSLNCATKEWGCYDEKTGRTHVVDVSHFTGKINGLLDRIDALEKRVLDLRSRLRKKQDPKMIEDLDVMGKRVLELNDRNDNLRNTMTRKISSLANQIRLVGGIRSKPVRLLVNKRGTLSLVKGKVRLTGLGKGWRQARGRLVQDWDEDRDDENDV